MNCKEFENHIIEHIEKTLNEKEAKGFGEHSDNCSSCKLLLQEFSESYNFIGLKAGEIENPYFYTRLLQKLDNKSKRNIDLGIFKKVLQPVAISILIMIGIYFGNYLGNYYHSSQLSSSEEMRQNQINAYAEENYILLAENESLENFLISNK